MAGQKRFPHFSSPVFINTLLIGLVLICVSQSIFGEIILPKERLTWGETIKVEVIPRPESGLLPGDHAYLYTFFWRQGVNLTWYEPLKWDGKQFTCDLTLPDGWEYGYAAIVTNERWIEDRKGLLALNSKGQIPPGSIVFEIAHSWMSGKSRPADWEIVLDDELKRHPELWWLYPEVWIVHFMQSGGEVPTDLIRGHISGMEEAAESAQILRVLMQGYWDLDEVDKAFQMLEKLCERYPASPETVNALHKASYSFFKKGLVDEYQDRYEDLVVQVVNNAPENPGLRDRPGWLYSYQGIQLEAYRQLFASWTSDDEHTPYPYVLLAHALNRDGIEHSRAEDLARHGLNLLFSERPYVFIDRIFPGYAFRTLSELCAKRGDLAGALANIRAAQIYTLDHKITDLEKEAEIWAQGNRFNKAEEIALEAYRKGSPVSESFVRDLYIKRNGNDIGAEEYFWNRLTGEKQQVKLEEKDLAPDFKVTDINGNLVNSEKLRGKVVVLNFWFTGCGPCIGEMPELNRLVDDFSGDVRFLAFTFDPEDRVKSFLDNHDFKYEIVANEGTLKKSLGVKSHPTHFVIDGKGRIQWTGSGANPDNIQRMRRVIERLLKEPK